MTFLEVVETVGKCIDGAGVGVMVVGALAATVAAANGARQHGPDVYRRYRQQLGRSILLGLELLVATATSVAVLAGIVLIRTFLSFSLELEITGRWPWQKQKPDSPGGASPAD